MRADNRDAALDLAQEIFRILDAINTPNPKWLHRQDSVAEIVNVLLSIHATRASRSDV